MDIVERLRNHTLPDPSDEREVMHAPLLRQAADEIQRLRDEVAELRKDAERYRYLMEHLGGTVEDNPILHSIPDDAVPTVVVNPNPE